MEKHFTQGIVVLIVINILALLSFYWNSEPLIAIEIPAIKSGQLLNSSISNITGWNTQKEKIFKILYWTHSYYDGPRWFGIGKDIFNSCDYSNCIATTNKTELLASDAVLFHMVFMKPFPKKRLPNQKWIMHVRECPAVQGGYQKYNGKFNTTWTYDRTSDIWTNYSQVREMGGFFVKRKPEEVTVITKNFAQGRKKLVAWFVSHCATQSKRGTYVKHLQNHITVDIYGACGKLKCGRNDNKCLDVLKRDYKFYLSFENSLCDDYVTEKLWKAINTNVVPIVLGAYNYSELLPPHSYIDVKDFVSAKKLADYLVKLDNNDTLYNKYFAWKGDYKIERHPPIQCNVCEYLNVAKDVQKVYDRLDLFWSAEKKCYKPSVFYKNVDKSVWI